MLSADARGRIVLSELIYIEKDDGKKVFKNLEILKRFEDSHFAPVKYLRELNCTHFFISFAPKEPPKIWNGKTGDLSIIINQYQCQLLSAIEIINESKTLILVAADGSIEAYDIEYDQHYTNVSVGCRFLKKSVFDKNHPISGITLKSANKSDVPYFALAG